MSDRIGVLGESVTATVATHTAYTVPAGKAAKFRIQWRALNAGVGNSTVECFVNGVSIFQTGNIAINEYCYSTTAFLNSASTATKPTGASAATTVAPAPPIYYANAGDTVTYAIATNALSTMSMQVVGVEVDV